MTDKTEDKSLDAARKAWEADRDNPQKIETYMAKIAAAVLLGAISDDDASENVKTLTAHIESKIKPDLLALTNVVQTRVAQSPSPICDMPPIVMTAMVMALHKGGVTADQVGEITATEVDGEIGLAIQRLPGAVNDPGDGIGVPMGRA